MNKLQFVKKRDGQLVLFEKSKIIAALTKAFESSGEGNRLMAQKLTETIVEDITRVYFDDVPDIEEIQDFVENTLFENNYKETAKSYILYRNAQAMKRKKSRIA